MPAQAKDLMGTIEALSDVYADVDHAATSYLLLD